MAERPTTTTDAGIPAPSDEYSLTTGPTGPILLQDHYLIQKMAQFNRERVPERVVHAKGAGAHGYFECHEDLRAFTRAKVFRKGRRTDAFVRFSSVAGEQGYPDTVRDPRGFAIKLYTEEGNYDLVGNNTPIFFIRDPQKFQDFIHSQKRRSDNGMRDHAMQWDFWTLSPETAHQVTFLMTDRGTPRTYRHMNGYGSHTFTWVNEDGQAFYVKYHFKTDQGIENFTRRDAQAMTAEDPDYHRRDLWNAMERGDEASWTLEMQIMPVTEAANYRFDPFDLTKVWPHADYPPIPVGRLVLNRNPDDYFAEVEQSAFEPSNLVPGIEPSPDRMLLGRLFSYPDAHRHRIGTNYLQLPINRPIGEVRSYNKDGAMRLRNPGDPVYAPNSRGGPAARPERYAETHVRWPTGPLVRAPQRRHPEDDDFGQARTLIDKVLGGEEVDHLVDNVVDHAGQGLSSKMQARVVDYWRSIHTDVGDRVARALGTE
ncbi:MAG: catalase [Spirochaetaceae bacterium]|nr:catalase [Myxococcales bacterium]MCB9724012.1 catalase [Spirochaetaceae bacterium]HPG24621.1 catalase [Myxococcota bacterium]